ncbi:hypothetical protein GCM10008955_30430 [Deinococcus malanensis]|uniref:Uncharacterized protein n=1 Tax=Deinococcus malanensis TaxID=1706855 RepID=A0ABQ2F017_9DEIO|nr:hypothetical protein [Deinococcus malanensis]GGK34290.1 hypothetical protein GCM10008955_30430 [Deinococcus malanensis]
MLHTTLSSGLPTVRVRLRPTAGQILDLLTLRQAADTVWLAACEQAAMSWSGPTVSLGALLGGSDQPGRDSASEAQGLLDSPLVGHAPVGLLEYASRRHQAAWKFADPSAGDRDLPLVREAMPVAGAGLLLEVRADGLRIEAVRGVVAASGLPAGGLPAPTTGWMSVRRTWQEGAACWTADLELEEGRGGTAGPERQPCGLQA